MAVWVVHGIPRFGRTGLHKVGLKSPLASKTDLRSSASPASHLNDAKVGVRLYLPNCNSRRVHAGTRMLHWPGRPKARAHFNSCHQ